MQQSQSLVVIGTVFPEPKSSAAGKRMMQLIEMFQSFGYQIIFATAAKNIEFSEDLLVHKISIKSILLNDCSFDKMIIEINPSIVLFDRYMMEEQYGWRVSKNCPNALKILDTEDLHFLRQARQLAIKENSVFETKDLYSELAQREIACILRCDISFIISAFEMEILENQFSISKSILHYLPLFATKETKPLLPFSNRNDFIFIGNCLHEPNWDCIKYLSKTVWPLIHKKLPEAKMLVYGAYPSQKVLELHCPKNNFMILGRAIDAQEVVMKAKIVLAPIRFGAGLKGKLLEAMQCGTPSITSSIGAEGIIGELSWNGKIADNPEEFANAAIDLYQNEKKWLKNQENGFEILEKRFAKNLFETTFYEKIISTLKDITKHRNQNFIGKILQHQSLNSSKYMSKWIEEKNKKN